VVTLESILPEGTRRDVLCQKGSLRATVELKMSLRWTLEDYAEALEKQLQGQYMMAPNSKIGFFVVELNRWCGGLRIAARVNSSPGVRDEHCICTRGGEDFSSS
jgi:hypothetical protein